MKTPVEIHQALKQLRDEIRSSSPVLLTERDNDPREGWRGADVIVTSDFERQPGWMDGHKLWVPTRHAQELGWLFRCVRDAFQGWYDYRNKYGFFGSLGQAALRHLAQNQPEAIDHRPLLHAVLPQAEAWASFLEDHGCLPENAPIVIHLTDSEGRQVRIDAASGEETV